MRLFLLLFVMLTGQLVWSQVPYVDLNYGTAGTAEIPIVGISFFFSEFDVDSLNRVYLSSELVFRDQDDNTVFTPLYTRLDAKGDILPYPSQVRDTSVSLGPLSFGFQWVEQNKILKYYSGLDGQDTVNTLSRFDLDFNLEQEYRVDLPLWFFGGLFHRPKFDEQMRLIVNDYGSLMRFLPNGTLDPDFANNGVLDLVEHKTFNDSLWHIFYNSIGVTSENGYVVNVNEYLPDSASDQPWFDSFIISINEDGSTNDSFGVEGVKENDKWEFYESITINQNDEVIVKGLENDLSDTICNPSIRYHLKLDNQGTVDRGFGRNGYFDDDVNGCLIHNFNFLHGPEGQIAFYQSVMTSDSTVSYFLGVLDEEGTLSSAFNDGQLLNIDDLPGGSISEMILDDDHNLYVLTSVVQFPFGDTGEGNFYVTKFNAIDIWDLPRYSSPSDPGALSFYPNPTMGVLNFEYDGPELEPVLIEVFDMLGRKVCTDKLQLDRRATATINYTNKLDSGNYFINITEQSGAKILVEKLIFLR
jgi:hypothetical protein